jgi:hypothetical protein
VRCRCTPSERQRAITDLLLLLDGRRASVTQISERLKVTTETVRATWTCSIRRWPPGTPSSSRTRR